RVLRVEMLSEGAPGSDVLALAVAAGEHALAAGAVRSARRALTAAERVVRAGAPDADGAARVPEARRRVGGGGGDAPDPSCGGRLAVVLISGAVRTDFRGVQAPPCRHNDDTSSSSAPSSALRR